MSGRSGSESRQRVHQIGVRLSPDELARLIALAHDRGLGVAEYLREDAGVRDDRHEIGVATPARHEMLVQVGEDPAEDAKRFRRTAQGVTLITQAMIDQLDL